MEKVPHQYVCELSNSGSNTQKEINNVIQEAASLGYTVKNIATTSCEYGLHRFFILFEKVE